MTVLISIGAYQILFIIAVVLLPLIAIVDILKSDFKGRGKMAWLAILFLTNIIGAITYFIVGRRQKITH